MVDFDVSIKSHLTPEGAFRNIEQIVVKCKADGFSPYECSGWDVRRLQRITTVT